jgi:nucleoside-diphosphate-sugar epimerase
LALIGIATAAGGNQGKILIPKAAKAEFTVRAMRRSKDADELLAIGASEVVIGDASNPNDVAKAMEGVSTVYHVGPTVHPNEKAMGLTVIEAAQKAGDKHLIYSSTMHAATSEMVPHRERMKLRNSSSNPVSTSRYSSHLDTWCPDFCSRHLPRDPSRFPRS